MDTESLAKRLLEIRTLLEQAQRDATSELPLQTLDTQQRLVEDSYQQIMLLQEILLNSPIGMAVISGPDLIFRLANATYSNFLPDPNAEIIGQPYGKIWPVDQGFEGDGPIRRMLSGGKNLNFDRLEQRYPDGLIRNYSLRICRLNWHSQPGALILIQETTQADRARLLAMEIAEEAHRRAEELDAIIMAMAEAVTIFDVRGTAVRANPAAIDLFGIDPVSIDLAELVDLLAMRHPDGEPFQIADLPSQRALQGETVVGQHILLVDDENHERVVLASASPLFDDGGVSAVVTVWHDVTEREGLLEQLEIEQSRLETIIKNAPEAILVADEEGRLVLGNPAAERIFGRAIPYEQEMESHAELNICYNDYAPYEPRNLPLTCSALDGEQLNNVELLVILPDGQERNVLTSTAPIVDRKGNLNGAVGVFQDITQRKQAEEILRRQASRSHLLAALSQQFAEAGLHYQELLDTIVRQVGHAFGDLCSLHLFDEEGKWYKTAAAFIDDPERFPVLQQLIQDIRFQANEGLTGRVFATGQPVMVTDLPIEQIETLLPAAHSLFRNDGSLMFINALVVPMRARGRWVGALSILRLQRGKPFHAEDQAFLQDLAERAALAIENTLLYEREARRAHEFQALHSATTALLSTIDLETLLNQILNAARQAIPDAVQGVLYLLSTENHHLEVRASFGCQDPALISPELEFYTARAVQEKKALILNAIAGFPTGGSGQSTQAGSAMIAPLKADQSVKGALALFGPHPKLFHENHLELLDAFAATATAALQNATLYTEVQRLATTDSVTELYNRRKFFELGELEMHRSRRFHNVLSAIMLDLDNFKEINDTFGHAAGDQALHAIAQRCRASIRVVDILGRYGGDEFAILLPGADLQETREIAERIRQMVVTSPITTERGEVTISISLGIAQAGPETESVSSLLGQADAALYNAKQGGRTRVMQD